MTIGLSLALRNDRLQAVAARLDAAGPGRLQLYAGTRPATGGEPEAPEALLAELALASPPGTVDAATLTLTPPEPTPALRSGLPAWCRLADGDGVQVIDGDVGIPGAGALVELEEDPAIPGQVATLYAGGLVTVTGAVLHEGNP